MIALAFLAVALVFAAYRLGLDYMRRSKSSFASAENAWTELHKSLVNLAESSVPPVVVQLGVALATTTGCGCLVRGVLIGHYLPRAMIAQTNKPSSFDRAFSELDRLGIREKELFDKVMGMAIIYDSYRNPLQGWLFRRVLASYVDQSYSGKLETKLATASVLSRRTNRGLVTA